MFHEGERRTEREGAGELSILFSLFTFSEEKGKFPSLVRIGGLKRRCEMKIRDSRDENKTYKTISLVFFEIKTNDYIHQLEFTK